VCDSTITPQQHLYNHSSGTGETTEVIDMTNFNYSVLIAAFVAFVGIAGLAISTSDSSDSSGMLVAGYKEQYPTGVNPDYWKLGDEQIGPTCGSLGYEYSNAEYMSCCARECEKACKPEGWVGQPYQWMSVANPGEDCGQSCTKACKMRNVRMNSIGFNYRGLRDSPGNYDE